MTAQRLSLINGNPPNHLPETTIWIWPTGLYPRRLVYYFLAKRLTTSTLQAHNIHLIPVTLTPDKQLVAKPSYEARPPNASFPCLRIQKPDTRPFFIYESGAIMEYLEEIFPTGDEYNDLRGATIEQRARCRDIVGVLNDAILYHGQHLIHSHPYTLEWSGLKREDWSVATASHAKARKHQLLSRIEDWVYEEIIEKEAMSLAGEGADVTLADISFMAIVQYNQEYYDGLDFLEEHGVLRVWYERVEGAEWCVGREELERFGKGDLRGLGEEFVSEDGRG